MLSAIVNPNLARHLTNYPACWRCWHGSRTRAGGGATGTRLVFLVAVAVACVLAGAKNFREIGDQAGDLPQEVLAWLGGRLHPLARKIIAPSGKRIRTVLQEIDAARLDELTGAGCAPAGRPENLLRAIAIDGQLPHVTRAVRICRDGYDAVGTLISKEIVHAVTSLGEDRAGPADLAKIARGQWGIQSIHWVRHRIPGRFQHWLQRRRASDHGHLQEHRDQPALHRRGQLRSTALSRPSDATGPACSTTYRSETPITNDFADPVGLDEPGVESSFNTFGEDCYRDLSRKL